MTQWRKDIASWRCGKTLYVSVPFTWLLPKAERMARAHKGKVIAGGPAVDLMGVNWADTPRQCAFDTLAFHNPCATFTTRGCTNRCAFCAVPEIEGDFRELSKWKLAPVVCDNNILVSSRKHFEKVIDSLLVFPKVDFNQGLSAGLFTAWHADQIARLKSCKVRFAFDFMGMEGKLADAIHLARRAGLRDFGVYVLLGYNDTPEDAIYRLESVRSYGIRPTPMRYQPLDCLVKNSYVAPEWSEYELRRVMQYYSRLRWYEHIPFADFRRSEEPVMPLFDKQEA